VVGFIPAIFVFVFTYMNRGFHEGWPSSLGYAAATGTVCWVVFNWALNVVWPHSLVGDMMPILRSATGLL